MPTSKTPTPNEARDALAAVASARKAAFKRGLWPRWAMAIEATWIGVLLVMLGHFTMAMNDGGASPLLLGSFIAIIFLGLGFRYFCVFRFKVVPKMTALDWLLIVVIYGFVAVIAFLWTTGSGWPFWAIGTLGAGLSFGKSELARRRAREDVA